MKRAHNFIDLTGKRFGRLLVIELIGRNKHRQLFWFCRCDCGKEKEIKGLYLRNGDTKSCGCLNKENFLTHGMTGTRIYIIWGDMKSRCLNPNSIEYKNYGKRGIKICESWIKYFDSFYEDMKDGYADNLTLDRIDSNGNYESSNCRWATIKEQNNNYSRNHLLTYQGKIQNITQWAEELKINRDILYRRIIHGWSIEKALTTPKIR